MRSCGYCGTTIVLGGKRDGDQRFCDESCRTSGQAVARSRQLPDGVVEQQVMEMHSGRCPKCEGAGPVDVGKSFKVWSAVYVCSWRTVQVIACPRCRRNAQLGALASSLILGWWSVHGLIRTPVQTVRNLVALSRAPDPLRPSADLDRLVRVQLGSQLAAPAASA